jgi:uroporphyrinogen decarboxylase
MNKREFLKSSIYAVGGLTLSPALANAANAATRTTGRISSGFTLANKREKILGVLDMSKPNRYVPAAFFMHFGNDKFGDAAVQRHIDYFRATDMDFAKVQYELELPRMNITRPEDWAKVPVYGKDFFEPQLKVIEAIAKQLKREALILPTVYATFSLAYQTAGRRQLVEQGKANPDAVKRGLQNIAESILIYIREAVKRGADGFYVSTQGGERGRFGDDKLFRELIVPFDKMVLQECSDLADVNILHICDYESPYDDIYRFSDYPASIINPPVRTADEAPISLKEVGARFRRPVMGGLDKLGALSKGNAQQIIAEVDKVMADAPQNFILGADCTIPGTVPLQTLRTVIDYAHNWRTEH